MPPQGLMTFPGLQQIQSGTYTLSHGVAPSTALLRIVPQFGTPSQQGDFKITFDGVAITFPGSIIDSASLRRTRQGNIWSLRILDRRWKWRYPHINGWYNRRRADGSLDTTTEKTPRELATLCLQAMGETNFSVDELPDLARPEVDWVYATASNELATLCDSLGCRVVLGIDNSVSVRRKGLGGPLPVPNRITDGFGIDPPEKPDKVLVVGGPKVWQSKFRLEAVGKEDDGSIKLIDDLTYKPAAGWEKEDPDGFWAVLSEHGEDDHKLALETVFRWYRIKGFVAGSGVTTTVPQASGATPLVVDRWQVLPLGDGLVDTYTDPDGLKRSKPPQIAGKFYDGRESLAVVTDTKVDVGFSIGGEQGIVKFSEAVWFFDADNGNDTTQADLVLEITHPVRDETTRQPYRYTRERTLSGTSLGTQPAVLRRDEIIETMQATYDASNNLTGVTTNTTSADAEADHHIDAAEIEFQVVESQDVEYAGIVPIQPDGSISQVSWSVGLNGAFTRAGQNTEFDPAVPSYKRRREIEQQRETQKKDRGASKSARKEIPIFIE